MEQNQYLKDYLYRRIVQAKLFIDDNYMENIEVDQVANKAAFSKFHFIRLFKSLYGCTPHQYLRDVRIEKAQQLLKSSQSVTDVCFSIGFESLGSFTTLFKRIVGLTPSAYQAEQKRLKAEVQNMPLRFIPNCFALTMGIKENSNFE